MSARKKAKTDEPAKEFTDEPDLRVIFEPDLRVKPEEDAGEDEECVVHSLILMLASPVFRQMLMTTMGEQKRGEVRLPGKSKAEFLDFYASMQPFASVRFTDESAVYLSRWADEYQVSALKDLCEDYMMNHMTVTPDRFVEYYDHATMYRLTKRVEQCVKVMKDNLLEFVRVDNNVELMFKNEELYKEMFGKTSSPIWWQNIIANLPCRSGGRIKLR